MVLSGQVVNNVPIHPLLTATVNGYSVNPTVAGFKCVKTVSEGRTMEIKHYSTKEKAF